VKFDTGLRPAYAACSSGAIRVVQEEDADHFRKLEDVPVGKLVHSLAVDPPMHRVFAPGTGGEWPACSPRMVVFEPVKQQLEDAMRKTQIAILALVTALVSTTPCGQADGGELLKLETAIPMPDVQGRIDHLAVDVSGRRLFVAALGNDSIEVIDLNKNGRTHTVHGLAEPQGIAFIPSVNRVFVANRKDGSVRAFDARSWAVLKSIPFGEDADNLRVDQRTGHVWVGYGSGALAEFDVDGTKIAEIKLDAHPESFQIEKTGSRIFVNLPKSRKIGVVDRKSRSTLSSWSTGGALSNYPMAVDERNRRLFVVTRSPAKFLILNMDSGKEIESLPATGDCDDVFYDERRHRIYAIGGEGGISVFDQRDADHYVELARIKTVPGARTGFFSSDLDRLYVAVRKQESQTAEIRVYAPLP
jgi:YVTN family beta-propeller protein